MKISIVEKLIKAANTLDSKGYVDEAAQIDLIVQSQVGSKGIRIYEKTMDIPDEDDDTPIGNRSPDVEDVEFIPIEIDEYDIEEGITVADLVVEQLKNNGLVEPSDENFPKWYSTVSPCHDGLVRGQYVYRDGVLENFTDEERREIGRKMQ